MPKGYSRRDFFRLLKDNGYHVVRKRGSHFIWKNADGSEISINKDPNRMVCERLIKENDLTV